MNQEFKLKLDLISFVKLSGLTGFCFGVSAIPIVLLFGKGYEYGFVFLFIQILGTPILSLLNGFLSGIIGFPLYRYLASKVGFKYKGQVWYSS